VSGTCDTCEHWRGSPERDPEDDWHQPGLPEIGTSYDRDDTEAALELRRVWIDAHRWGTCKRIDHLTVTPPVLACVQDGSGYRAELITAAEYGCVHHEEKS
jgi:hypothetical protein